MFVCLFLLFFVVLVAVVFFLFYLANSPLLFRKVAPHLGVLTAPRFSPLVQDSDEHILPWSCVCQSLWLLPETHKYRHITKIKALQINVVIWSWITVHGTPPMITYWRKKVIKTIRTPIFFKQSFFFGTDENWRLSNWRYLLHKMKYTFFGTSREHQISSCFNLDVHSVAHTLFRPMWSFGQYT